MSQFFSPKTPMAVIKLGVDWTKALAELGDTIQSATWAITNTTDPSEVTTAMLQGAVDLSKTGQVWQKVSGGTAGCVYEHTCTVTTTGGQTIPYSVRQSVKADS
ncbi:phage fiber-tail adaptor protein [Mesoterricola sediminis]|uniref:Uncharacterized protein n=1 Tax=Mesoterricola sediminis TaxID=2927980 RepID=A0AA48GYC4_9BACT|nr:hypothetical protein [Mesoterricola sediminis]BDU76292.1 hypothetical protein METESE_12500 [Mesoterricola sediminis]